MVNGIDAGSDVAASRDEVAIEGGAAGADFAPESGSGGRRHSEGFVNTSTEVNAGAQAGTESDFVRGGERVSNFGGYAVVPVLIVGEVEEARGEGCGGCVRAWKTSGLAD